MTEELNKRFLLEYAKSKHIMDFVRILRQTFPDAEYKNASHEDGTDRLRMMIPEDDFPKAVDLDKVAKKNGWFVANIWSGWGEPLKYTKQSWDDFFAHPNSPYFIITFERYYDEEIADNQFYFHLTPIENWPLIKQKGLKPRAGNKISYHPRRVYVGINFAYAKSLAEQLYHAAKDRDKLSGVFAILKIDASKVPNIKLMRDPDYENGAYTYSVIPPEAIKLAKKIDVKPKPKKEPKTRTTKIKPWSIDSLVEKLLQGDINTFEELINAQL